jgi:uncharacterized protein
MMTHRVPDIAALEALYAQPGEASVIKVTDYLTPEYRHWIGASRFCVLSTIGPEGTDGSPRGDEGPVVQIADDRTLLLPDWRGNNRMDSLRNIVRDGRVSLMFLIPGSHTAMRVNGTAHLSVDPDLLAGFARTEGLPKTVIIITIAEVYSQCARALIRAGLWRGVDESAGLPTVGDMLRGVKAGFDGAAYDADWPGRAARTMWAED